MCSASWRAGSDPPKQWEKSLSTDLGVAIRITKQREKLLLGAGTCHGNQTNKTTLLFLSLMRGQSLGHRCLGLTLALFRRPYEVPGVESR